MFKQGLKAVLAVGLVALIGVMVSAVHSASGGKGRPERAEDLVLLAERPEDPQRAIVLVKATRVENGMLTVELELRNNSAEPLQGHVWGQAKLGARTFVESSERPSYKAKIKTFKTLRFPLPAGFDGVFPEGPALEIMVSDDATGLATRYGSPMPKGRNS